MYASEPVGVLDQPDFLNLVVQIETTHAPLDLLAACLRIEAGLGRERRERWGPRIIDLDVLTYDTISWNDDRLVLPHPQMLERGFVLIPLAEIAPDKILQGASVREHATRVGAAGLHRELPWAALAALVGLPPRPTCVS